MDHLYNIVNSDDLVTIGVGVADNIRKILTIISTQFFSGNTLTLSTIETIGEKKIAVIDLVGDESYWYNSMQGSTGGLITAYTLTENILQKEYPGYWIDGVRFTVNGHEVTGNQHAAELSVITYR